MSYDASPIIPALQRLARKIARTHQVEHDDLVQAACLRLWRFDRECDEALAMTIAERAMIDEIRRLRGRTGTARHAAATAVSLNTPTGERDDQTRMDLLQDAGADPLAYLLAKEALEEHAAEQKRLADAPKVQGTPRELLAGMTLSPREMAVMEQARRGKNALETGTALSISEHTVKHHRTRAAAKLNASNLVHAVAILYDLDLWPRTDEAAA